MGIYDIQNAGKIAGYLNRADLEGVHGRGWQAVGKVEAYRQSVSSDRVRVMVNVKTTETFLTQNDEIQTKVSYYINKLMTDFARRYPEVIAQSPPKIDLVIKKK